MAINSLASLGFVAIITTSIPLFNKAPYCNNANISSKKNTPDRINIIDITPSLINLKYSIRIINNTIIISKLSLNTSLNASLPPFTIITL